MLKRFIITSLSLMIATSVLADKLVWPPAPDNPKIEYISEIKCDDLSVKSGFFGKIGRLLGGKTESEILSLPFDLAVHNNFIYLTCQNIPALIEIDREQNNFRMITNEKQPLRYPIAVAVDSYGVVYLTDSDDGSVFRYADNKLTRFITDQLNRPTGIAVSSDGTKIYVIDTGDHSLKEFDLQANLISSVPGDDSTISLHFPTFATCDNNDKVWVNDALNYRIKQFDEDCNYITQFGKEGDSPGSFSRPKGLAVDSDSHIYVVDNLFDNIQIFDKTGQLLLVIGSGGQAPGQFWSPGGIAISNDTIFVADTHNNRIQILRYLGDK